MAESGKKRRKTVAELVDFGSQGMGVGAMQETEAEYMASALDLFSISPTEDTMLYNRESKYYPTGSVNDMGPYQFNIPAENSLFIDTSSIRLEGRVKLVKIADDGTETALLATDKGFLVNLWPHSLFRSVEISLNGVMVSYISSPAAHYRAMIETLLSYGLDSGRTHLASSGFRFDEAGKFEATDTASFTAGPTKDRAELFKESAVCDFMTPLHSDVLRDGIHQILLLLKFPPTFVQTWRQIPSEKNARTRRKINPSKNLFFGEFHPPELIDFCLTE